ncbi:hypothetical protein N7509_000656 [Penicillium cosmopolitanum]|uniref:Uncharacterized protein n=1 Tax=Penicillium cosmopolitanum TaxID=1131564 RepID=A0A9W9WBD3_9EURO|nr:uncharacterized protein N7509_000656 [Penicillium cosmopolitanum]KAJ5414029.1 hypothetical protein N7509_000656 [Penicillium cosmopolitanum]
MQTPLEDSNMDLGQMLSVRHSVPTLTGETNFHPWEAALKSALDDINPELWRVITGERMPTISAPIWCSPENLITFVEPLLHVACHGYFIILACEYPSILA